MPLPKTHFDVHFIGEDSVLKKETLKKRETGYEATTEYYPTMRAVKCSKCGMVGVAEFLGGLNLKEGDRVMEGKTIRGTCTRCRKLVDLVPLPVNDPENKKALLYYQMQQALDGKVKRQEKLSPTGNIWPVERAREWERMKNGGQGGT